MGKRFGLALLITAAFLAACQKQKESDAGTGRESSAAQASTGLEVKDRFGPGMTFPHVPVVDHLGNRYDLYNLLNKPGNIVMFIDAFCAACGEEGKMIQRYATGRADVGVIGVSRDSMPAILNFKKRHKLLFPILRDAEEKLVPDYRRVAFPTLVLAGPDKKIIQLYEGDISAEEAGPLFRALLGL